jgi:hypothetical protein
VSITRGQPNRTNLQALAPALDLARFAFGVEPFGFAPSLPDQHRRTRHEQPGGAIGAEIGELHLIVEPARNTERAPQTVVLCFKHGFAGRAIDHDLR